jgi:hypothetical protein
MPARLYLLLILTGITYARAGESVGPAKKLIEFGWDEPDTGFIRQHIGEMEATPFDGCVFHINYSKPQGRGNFMWECWDRRAFTAEDLRASLDDLKATKFTRFTHNFLRFNTAPGKIDWFEDFSAIVNNAKLAAQVAHEGHCEGILFDIEQYNFPLFNYRKQRDAARKSWEQYAAQVRRRGREVMEGFQDGFPGLTIFLTFGYSLPWAQTSPKKRPLADCDYGMLAPFMDGLIEGAKGETRLVDGNELAYGYKEPAQFDKSYRTIRTNLLSIVADPKKYHDRFSAGFGLWMDNNWRKHGWNTNDFSKNYFTPEVFESSLRKALNTADEYVWIYTESPRWWSKGGGSVNIPAAYESAVQQAHPLITK